MPDTSLPPPLTANDVRHPRQPASSQTPRRRPLPCLRQVATVAISNDNAVSDRLRELISSKQLDRLVSRKADRDGVDAYYKAHNYTPLWVTAGAANARAKQAIAYLAQVDTVGLDPTDYPTPDFKAATTADAQAEAEIKLTASVLNFARQAQIGRIHFTRVAADIQFDLNAPDPADVLTKLADSSDAAAALDGYNPPQPEFKALKDKLAELRKNGGESQSRRRQQARARWPSAKAKSCAPA